MSRVAPCGKCLEYAFRQYGNSNYAQYICGDQHDTKEAPMGSHLTLAMNLSVPRTEVITRLTARRAEVEKAYNDKIEAGRKLATDAGAPGALWAAYYRRLADLIDAKKLKMDMYGQITKGQNPPRPQHYRPQDVEQAVVAAEQARDQALQVIDDTLSLLNVAVDDNVQVSGEHYQSFLSTVQTDTSLLDHYLG